MAFVALSGAASLLTFGVLLLIGAKLSKSLSGEDSSFSASSAVLISMLATVWLFWFVLGLIYWRGRDPSTVLSRTINGLLTASWLEFSLALPIYIATRDNDRKCYWLTESYFAMIVIIGACIFMFGPGLFLLYLREKEVAKRNLARVVAILGRKSVVAPTNHGKADSFVSNARTMSLIAISLGFVGLALGIFNEQRSALYNECRNLLLITYVKKQFKDDATLERAINSADGKTGKKVFHHTPLGELTIQLSEGLRFRAAVSDHNESWTSNAFQLDETGSVRLQTILYELDIKEGIDDINIVSALRRAVYQISIPVPAPGLSLCQRRHC
jgi:hypothetical protein